MKVLIVENDAVLLQKMVYFLQTEGHWCETYAIPEPALVAVATHGCNDYIQTVYGIGYRFQED